MSYFLNILLIAEDGRIQVYLSSLLLFYSFADFYFAFFTFLKYM